MTKGMCKVEGCERPARRAGWCGMHYHRVLRHGDPGPAETERPRQPNVCIMDGCTKKAKTQGLCATHYQRVVRNGDPSITKRVYGLSAVERVLALVDKDGPIAKNNPELGPCWVRMDGKARWWDIRNEEGRSVKAYRITYEHFVGPVPEGLELDHFACDNGPGGCANPHHVRPVTDRENTLRGNSFSAWNAAKTQCPQGHPYDEVNTYYIPSTGGRICRICQRERSREIKRRRRAEAKAARAEVN